MPSGASAHCLVVPASACCCTLVPSLPNAHWCLLTDGAHQCLLVASSVRQCSQIFFKFFSHKQVNSGSLCLYNLWSNGIVFTFKEIHTSRCYLEILYIHQHFHETETNTLRKDWVYSISLSDLYTECSIMLSFFHKQEEPCIYIFCQLTLPFRFKAHRKLIIKIKQNRIKN